MRKYHFFLTIISIFLWNCIGYSQPEQKDSLKLEVRCYDAQYVGANHSNATKPSFILGIRNNRMFAVDLNPQILFGHAGDEEQNDITFELYYLSGKDTVNVLKTVRFNRLFRTRVNNNKITINPTAGYFFEFDYLNDMYLRKSGRYMIRFTLLKKYAAEYMTKNTSTDWIYFDVDVPKQPAKNSM
jgi:hypothetical protein